MTRDNQTNACAALKARFPFNDIIVMDNQILQKMHKLPNIKGIMNAN